jgi:hypothetical protein
MKESQVEGNERTDMMPAVSDQTERCTSLQSKRTSTQDMAMKVAVSSIPSWHSSRCSSESERSQSALVFPDPITDFSAAALKTRELIGVFLNESVHERILIGFRGGVEQRPLVATVSVDLLLTSLVSMRDFLESELLHPEGDDCVTQIYCDTYHSIQDVIEITRKASSADGAVREDYIEPLAFELLEFRAVLVSKALELGAHIVSGRVQADVAVNTIHSDPEALILTIAEDSLVHQMLRRQEELRNEVLPSIQTTALHLVQHVLLFIETLRNQEVKPLGFDRKERGEHHPVAVEEIIDNLRDTLYKLDDHFEALSEETPMDINFRAYIHNMSHFIGAFRIALIRQKRNGYIPEGAVQVVQQQAQHTFQEVTQAVKQLTTVANVDLLDAGAEEVCFPSRKGA